MQCPQRESEINVSVWLQACTSPAAMRTATTVSSSATTSAASAGASTLTEPRPRGHVSTETPTAVSDSRRSAALSSSCDVERAPIKTRLCVVDELLSSGDFSSGVGWEDEEEKDADENAEEEEEEAEPGESDDGGYIW